MSGYLDYDSQSTENALAVGWRYHQEVDSDGVPVNCACLVCVPDLDTSNRIMWGRLNTEGMLQVLMDLATPEGE